MEWLRRKVSKLIKQFLISNGINVNDTEFKDIMAIVTDDIRINRIAFNKKTSFNEVLLIVLITTCMLKRIITSDLNKKRALIKRAKIKNSN